MRPDSPETQLRRGDFLKERHYPRIIDVDNETLRSYRPDVTCTGCSKCVGGVKRKNEVCSLPRDSSLKMSEMNEEQVGHSRGQNNNFMKIDFEYVRSRGNRV